MTFSPLPPPLLLLPQPQLLSVWHQRWRHSASQHPRQRTAFGEQGHPCPTPVDSTPQSFRFERSTGPPLAQQSRAARFQHDPHGLPGSGQQESRFRYALAASSPSPARKWGRGGGGQTNNTTQHNSQTYHTASDGRVISGIHDTDNNTSDGCTQHRRRHRTLALCTRASVSSVCNREAMRPAASDKAPTGSAPVSASSRRETLSCNVATVDSM